MCDRISRSNPGALAVISKSQTILFANRRRTPCVLNNIWCSLDYRLYQVSRLLEHLDPKIFPTFLFDLHLVGVIKGPYTICMYILCTYHRRRYTLHAARYNSTHRRKFIPASFSEPRVSQSYGGENLLRKPAFLLLPRSFTTFILRRSGIVNLTIVASDDFTHHKNSNCCYPSRLVGLTLSFLFHKLLCTCGFVYLRMRNIELERRIEHLCRPTRGIFAI